MIEAAATGSFDVDNETERAVVEFSLSAIETDASASTLRQFRNSMTACDLIISDN